MLIFISSAFSAGQSYLVPGKDRCVLSWKLDSPLIVPPSRIEGVWLLCVCPHSNDDGTGLYLQREGRTHLPSADSTVRSRPELRMLMDGRFGVLCELCGERADGRYGARRSIHSFVRKIQPKVTESLTTRCHLFRWAPTAWRVRRLSPL